MTNPSASTTNTPNGPLSGVRVLDLGRVLSAPFASTILADLGADVIKLEDAERGDTVRGNAPFISGQSHYQLALNRSKRSIAVDVKTEEGAEVLRRLIGWADVLVDNFRPHVLPGLGLDTPDLKKINPYLIHCSVTGFGAFGDFKNRPAFDITIQALSGCMDVTGEEGGPPAKLGIPLCDLAAGIYAAIAITAALTTPRDDRPFRRLEVAMIDSAISLLSYMGTSYFADGSVPTRLGTGHPTIYPYNAFEASDGEVVVAPFTQRFWRNFCRAIGQDDLRTDPRFLDFRQRLKNKHELAAILNPVMAQRPVADWVDALEAADVPCGPVLTIGEALELDQTAARGMIQEISLTDGSSLKTLGSPFRFGYRNSGTYTPPVRRAAKWGEHTKEVLEQIEFEQDHAAMPDLSHDDPVGRP